ncbi:MAG: hypothetical protein JO316_05770 [Abitibacteriaceae bacterium]|nr:hypothetical protein [Abditibacteriaceae bacterium]
MKLHLRLIKIGVVTYHIITLRPGTQVAYSTNYFHETWHIISDMAGAKLLARLLWGLSFQKMPNTVVIIHGEHIKPTPFDADPSDPIALIPACLTHLDATALHTLKHLMPHWGPSHQTIRWQTFGLDQALADDNEGWKCTIRDKVYWKRNKHLQHQEQMCRSGGFICYLAPPDILRLNAFDIYHMNTTHYEMDYTYLADFKGGHPGDGEVQIFRDYQQQLSAAAVARREVTPQIAASTPPDIRRDMIQQHCLTVQGRHRAQHSANRQGAIAKV